jgi:mRNA interferase MazF
MSTAPTPSPSSASLPQPMRGEVWLVDFDPAVGAEIAKVRPAVVVNVNTVGRLPLRLVVPLTDWKPGYQGYAWFVFLPADATNGLQKDSGVDTFQTKSISLRRFVRTIGQVTAAQMNDIAAAIKANVGAP